jgi:hypothetical protein
MPATARIPLMPQAVSAACLFVYYAMSYIQDSMKAKDGGPTDDIRLKENNAGATYTFDLAGKQMDTAGQPIASDFVPVRAYVEPALLALERSYTMGVGNRVRIYRLDLAGASDVADREGLGDTSFTAVRKTLMLDLAVLGIPMDNLEGMSWGPLLPNGRRTLILVSDNNFSARQITQLLAFEMRPE